MCGGMFFNALRDLQTYLPVANLEIRWYGQMTSSRNEITKQGCYIAGQMR